MSKTMLIILFVAAVLLAIWFAIMSSSKQALGDDEVATAIFTMLFAGVAVFLGAKLFCRLEISYWWILLSPIWFFIALVFPGGFTLTSWLMSSVGGLMLVPIWVYIVGGVLDLLMLCLFIFQLFENRPSAAE